MGLVRGRNMRYFLIAAVACAGLAGFQAGAQTVGPAYEGRMGNAEEPALRPYKWMWHGVKSLFYQTGNSFVRGNMHFPVLGTAETGRGLRRGTVEVVESTYRGAVFAIPPQEEKAYKTLGTTNEFIEEDLLLRNVTDFAFTLYAYPALKYVDHYPLEDDEKVDIRLDRAKTIREERKAAQQARRETEERRRAEAAGTEVEPESDVKRAQRRYIGDRADYGRDKRQEGRGNLLRLAR